MLLAALVSLVPLTLLMLALAFVVDLRIVIGWPLGLIYPPLGRAVMPGDSFGTGDRFERAVDWATAPMALVEFERRAKRHA